MGEIRGWFDGVSAWVHTWLGSGAVSGLQVFLPL